MRCRALPCDAVLCHAVPCCAVLCCAPLSYIPGINPDVRTYVHGITKRTYQVSTRYMYVRTYNHKKSTPSSVQLTSAQQRSGAQCSTVWCRALPCGAVLCRAAPFCAVPCCASSFVHIKRSMYVHACVQEQDPREMRVLKVRILERSTSHR